ncbi:alpha-adducin isoform X1 [Sinocyclocheilus rhinocerous]|uniref:alpha-adducin isoform X1 n=1 Tax=Sinocyclocheilus rhinocerous TaxID=307959 RepID=UPI0007B87F9E|nr:PREDICTED: alpha-adducin-like isoform X1 [Sinocyclocheilus rhinocerous]
MNGDSGAGVVTAPPPTNPPHKERYFDRVDESSPEYQRERNMAPDLRQDFNMMEQRKRVSMILQSPAFCDELESLIQDQMKKGKNPTSLLALQQIADFMTTSVPTVYPAGPQGGMAALNMSLGMVTPVNDLRGSDSIAYEKGEKLLRCKLAAFYRLADLFGWSQLIYNHLTVRLNSEQERFLIVPFGLLYSEVTASSLVKINLQGEIVDRGSTNLGVNQAGFTLHSAIYAARPDIKCIVHIHTPAGAAVSAMKCGLLPISPEALSLGEVAYHDYHGILVDEEENVLIQKNLGPKSKVLILRNHGLVTVGETVEEAFYYIHNLVTACEIQVRTLASAGGPDNLVMLDPSKYKSRPRHLEPVGDGSSSYPKWQIGEQEFEALMRMLDNLGYRTGYPYRCPALRDKAKKYSDVEIPPSATGYSYAEDSDSGVRSPLKHSFQRQQRDKTRWLAAGRPDESAEEGQDGSGSPKAKTKWTKEDSLRQAAVANQFVPMNTNPKEVQEMRNKIREQNLQDKKTAGPQSQVLTGAMVDRSYVQRMTIWHDAPLSDCTDSIDGIDPSESFSPSRSIRKGELVTASKAIIEKEYQPRVIVSKTGPNPFNKLTDQELEEYRREVELKQKGPEAQQCPPQVRRETVVLHLAQVEESSSAPEEAQTPDVTSTQENEDPQATTAPPPSIIESGHASGQDSPADAPGSPHKEFHSAVLKALGCDAESERDGPSAGQTPEVEEGKVPSATCTPPSSPLRVEEEAQQEQTSKDESDAATLRQTLPDLTPDEASEVAALPAEDPAPGQSDSAPQPEGEEPVAGDDAAGDHGSDESPNKSPSKKKKKFRTPSFLKKNKKKSETQ